MHRVTLREMEHFVALAEHGSVTGAAAIGLSQPAMSTSLWDLERTLGVTLFVRHRGRGLSLLLEGELLLAEEQHPTGELGRLHLIGDRPDPGPVRTPDEQPLVHGTTPRSGR